MKRRLFLAGIGAELGLLSYAFSTAAAATSTQAQSSAPPPLLPQEGPPPTPAKSSVFSAATTLATQDERTLIQQLTSLGPHQTRSERIALISHAMLGTPYKDIPLIGSPTVKEQLTLSLTGVNCMTFVELVVALSASHDETSFLKELISTRYLHHHVQFAERRHFLSDWLTGSPRLCRDVSCRFGPLAKKTKKKLNLKPNNTGYYVPNIPVKKRCIHYLPTQALAAKSSDKAALACKIRTGDIIGIYSPLIGLDVSHTGFAIWEKGELYFRNASSLKEHRYVIDTPLVSYLQERNRQGITIYRLI